MNNRGNLDTLHGFISKPFFVERRCLHPHTQTTGGYVYMKKKIVKGAVLTVLTMAISVPAFANPFTDVPAKHWAYDAVAKLAQAGIVDGYGDNTFKGDKALTRYEMAQIVSKVMNKSLTAEQKAVVDQLSKEFATELDSLGIKVDGLQSQFDNMVKLSGDARVRFATANNANDATDLRARIGFDGKVNNDVSFNARLSSTWNPNVDNSNQSIVLDTANVSFNALGLHNTVGRQDMFLGSGFMMDSGLNGIKSDIGHLSLFAGNTTKAERVYAAEYSTHLLGADVKVDYLKNAVSGDKLYGANASFGIAENVRGNIDYVKNDTNGAVAKAYGVKFAKAGLSATYRDVDGGAYTSYSTLGDLNGIASGTSFKGMEYQYEKALSKNTDLTIKHQNFDNDNKHTTATINVKF